MKIALYKDLSDVCEYVEIESGKTIQENLADVDFKNKICFCNGDVCEPCHIAEETDLISIRSIPHDMENVEASLRVFVAIVTLGISELINLGVQTNKNRQALAALESSVSSNEETITLPYIKNAPNSVATGKSQPYFIGKHLMTPYVLNGKTNKNAGYSTTSGALGEQQFLNIVLEGGFNKQIVKKIVSKNIVLKTLGANEAQEGQYCLDTSSIFASPDSFIEIAQDGNGFESSFFNNKIIEETANEQLKKHPASQNDDGTVKDTYEDLFYELEKNTMAADVCILFNGLKYTTASGASGQITRHIKAEYSLDYAGLVSNGDSDPAANATWTQFYFVTCNHTDAVYRHHEQFFQINLPMQYYKADVNLWDYKQYWRYAGGERFTVTEDMNLEIQRKDGFTTYVYYVIKVSYDEEITPEINTEVSAKDTETNTSKFVGNYNKQVRFNAHVDFNYNEVKNSSYPITLRISTPDREVATGTSTDDTYVQWIHSHIYNAKKSAAQNKFVAEKVIEDDAAALSTLIGLHIEASKQNEDKLKSIQIVSSGMAHKWDSESETWESDKSQTSNVASWIYEVLTSDTHKPSKILPSEIDNASFGLLYEYCEENDLQVNMVLTEGQTKQSVLESLCALGNCVLYRNVYGKIAVAIDTYKTDAVAVINPNNIVSFSYTKNLKRKTDGYLLTYTNAREDYEQDTVLIMADGAERTSNSVIEEQTVKGITDYDQLVKYSRRMIAKSKLRPKTCTADVGAEGIFYAPLSKVLVQHPSLAIGLGESEVKSIIYDGNNIVGLTLYSPIEYNSEDTDGYGVVIQSIDDDASIISKAYTSSTNGMVYDIRFVEPIARSAAHVPHVHDIVSYGYLNDGEFDTITSQMLITGIEKNGSNVRLSLMDYNEAVYDFGTIPEYESNITKRKEGIPFESDIKEIEITMEETKADAIKTSVPTSIVTYYAASESNTDSPAEFSTDPSSEIATLTAIKKYLWSYTVNNYSTGAAISTGAPAVVGVYGDKGEAGSGMRFDISPEQISLLNTTISETGATFQIKASFFNDATDLHNVATFKAQINNIEVGTWEDVVDGKIVTIPCSALNSNTDNTTVVLSASYNGTTRTALGTVTKIYSGQDAVIYKMLFSATTIKESASGEKNPASIEVQKRKVNANGESETQKGFVTVSIDGGEEQRTNEYVNQSSSDYKSDEQYYEKVSPFFLYTDASKSFVLGNGTNPASAAVVGGVFYN